MTTPGPESVRRAPGRLIAAPTALGNAPDYGGTVLGLVNGVRLQPLGRPVRIESEGLGEATDVLQPNHHYLFASVIRGWSNDALELLHPEQYSTGTITQHKVWTVPGTKVPGSPKTGVTLLFVPDDTLHVPAALIYSAMIDWQESAEIMFDRNEELAMQLVADCLKDSNGNTIAVGHIEDLSLT